MPQAKVVVAPYARNPRPAKKPLPKVGHTNAFEALPPKRMPKVKLRDSLETARAVGAAAQRVKDEVARAKAPTKELPPLAPERTVTYANGGKPAAVHMPAVRADEDSPSRPTNPAEATTKKEVAAQPEAKAEAQRQPLRTVAVDALQPAAAN